MNESHQIDPAALERLRRLGGDEFLLRMTNLFLTFGAQKLGEARDAIAAANLAGVAKAMHSLKSSAANVGALEVQNLATRIEGLALKPQGDSLAPLMQELELSFARTKLELESKPGVGSGQAS